MKDKVIQVGAEVLRQKAHALTTADITSRATRALITRMKKTLAGEEYGVAIAAPQVGKSVRLFVVAGRALIEDTKDEDEKKEIPPDLVFINPEITRMSKATREMSEGCLSVRGKYGTVYRHEKATVKAIGEDGKPFIYHGSGLMAHIFQHECDHLDGILYIDKAEKLVDDREREDLRNRFPTGQKTHEQ